MREETYVKEREVSNYEYKMCMYEDNGVRSLSHGGLPKSGMRATTTRSRNRFDWEMRVEKVQRPSGVSRLIGGVSRETNCSRNCRSW